MSGPLAQLAAAGVAELARRDAKLHHILEREIRRQHETLLLVASCSSAPPSVLACEGTVVANVTAEGYPGSRFHAGCGEVDQMENLAIERAKRAFGARYANVQPHSGSTANQVVLFSLLTPGDAILGMDLEAGGHLTHGSKASVIGRLFKAHTYGVGEAGLIDYEAVAAVARRTRPKLIICGTSAYARSLDFARFRAIADAVDAYLLADISHIAGLVAAGVHPSPIDHAHITTTSTYKQLCGPRGGLILIGRDAEMKAPRGRGGLAEFIQKAVFPYFQGTPNLAAVAAKARALAEVATADFAAFAARILTTARSLAKELGGRGYQLVGGGTDTHIVLLDLSSKGVSGAVAERALEDCGIVVNRNRVPGDRSSVRVTSGLRLGTNTAALRGMGRAEMRQCAALIDRVLGGIEVLGDRTYSLPAALRQEARAEILRLCRRFPLPGYPSLGPEGVEDRGEEGSWR